MLENLFNGVFDSELTTVISVTDFLICLLSSLVLGIVMHVGIQMILNIAVVTNTLPSTGISLPFFSYGGTSLMILLAEMGVVLSVSRISTIEKT